MSRTVDLEAVNEEWDEEEPITAEELIATAMDNLGEAISEANAKGYADMLDKLAPAEDALRTLCKTWGILEEYQEY